MTAITLHPIDPEKNKWRFYHLDVQPDLFGGWSLVREWGRIGRAGKVLTAPIQPSRKPRGGSGASREKRINGDIDDRPR